MQAGMALLSGRQRPNRSRPRGWSGIALRRQVNSPRLEVSGIGLDVADRRARSDRRRGR
jgi:hypothetical protein